MSFQIDRGLFLSDFIDSHAILGVSVEADIKEIRRGYLKIARRLHPDSCIASGEADRELAAQLLSKLVNPAWEKLSQDKARTDHLIVLKMKGQGAARRPSTIEVLSSLAQQLLSASNPEHFYSTALQDLSNRQYEHLDQACELIAQISELNLAYLIRREAISDPVGVPKTKTFASVNSLKAGSQKPEAKLETLCDQYYRRAEGFAAKGNYAQATIELRDALKIEPNSSRCHSLMGMLYLRQNQPTMAKIHFTKALSIDPQDERALIGKQRLDPSAPSSSKDKPTGKSNATKQTPSKPSSGLFGGLFGKKK
ncbi:MAG: J domain-containing protein [Leptolyngbya sp. Prado105]|jgi:tetratricopeptide (TPR) repeat protein|nr:J domain-containing protein [Leptolyngbya sp. Prado105]